MSEACIVGWAHTPFGRLPEPDIESLIARVARVAILDAGLKPAEIEAVFVSVCHANLARQDCLSSLVLQSLPELRFRYLSRQENACASGSAAIFAARDWLAAQRGRFALVVGAEKMTSSLPTPLVSEILLSGSHQQDENDDVSSGLAAVFGRIAGLYFQRFGDQTDTLAAIAAKNHHNALDNPYAQARNDLGFAFCREVSEQNPYIAPPLKRTDCAPISDGAAALVLTDGHTARSMAKAVRFRAAVAVSDFLSLSRRDPTRFEGAAQAWNHALTDAGLHIEDLSFVETHDCFTIAELMQYEAMGMAPAGRGARAVMEGWTRREGKLPVNPSGGLQGMGHPVAATGVSMHVMAAMQLTGQAGAMQLPSPDIAGVFNMGGAAVANYVSILEPAR